MAVARHVRPVPASVLFAMTAGFLAVAAFFHAVPVALAGFPLRFPTPALPFVPPAMFLPPLVAAVIVIAAQDLADNARQVLSPDGGGYQRRATAGQHDT